jgi:hypothetical protein
MTTDQDYLDNRAAEERAHSANGYAGSYAATVRTLAGVLTCMHCQAEFCISYTGTALDEMFTCPTCGKQTYANLRKLLPQTQKGK